METDKIIFGNAYELIKQVPDKSVDLIATDRVDGITKKERDSGYQQTKLF